MPVQLNERFSPLLLMSFEDPFAPGELDRHYRRMVEVARAALRDRVALIAILTSDPLAVSAAGRKQVAQTLGAHMTPDLIRATVASFVAIDSALVRGVLTAFRWLSPNTLDTLRVTATMEEALEQALKALDNVGTPFRGDLAALRRELKLST